MFIVTAVRICERCPEKYESATHIPCDCEAMAYQRFCNLHHYFMEAVDYHEAPISKLLHLIQTVGLIKG
jgi:hypothetical protein